MFVDVYFDCIYFAGVLFGSMTKLMDGAFHFTDQTKVSLLDLNISITSSTVFYQ